MLVIEAHRAGLGGEPGDEGQRLGHLKRREEIVVAHAHRVEAAVAGGAHLLDDVSHLRHGVLAGHELRVQDQPESHRSSFPPLSAGRPASSRTAFMISV